MNFKWIGAILIICGCALIGFSMSAAYRREERLLRQLLVAIAHMIRELQYRVTPLPDLCMQVSREQPGYVSKLFGNLAKELQMQVSPDVQSCLAAAAASAGQMPPKMQEAVCILGASLGRFDLEGQLQGLESVQVFCKDRLEEMSAGREVRLRSYQTLGLCAGAALAILLV